MREEMVRANEAQAAHKERRQQQQKEEEKVCVSSLW